MGAFRQIGASALFILVVALVIAACMDNAHISPVLASSPSPVPLPTPTLSLEQRIRALEEKIEEPRPKDFWDILNSVSTLISGGIIALLVAFIARRYQQRQDVIANALKEREIKVAQAEVVQSFGSDLLSGNTQRQEFAIGMIAALDARLATDLAYLIGGEAGFDALYRIVSIAAGTPEQQAVAKARLKDIAQIRLKERLQRVAETTGMSREDLEALLRGD